MRGPHRCAPNALIASALIAPSEKYGLCGGRRHAGTSQHSSLIFVFFFVCFQSAFRQSPLLSPLSLTSHLTPSVTHISHITSTSPGTWHLDIRLTQTAAFRYYRAGRGRAF